MTCAVVSAFTAVHCVDWPVELSLPAKAPVGEVWKKKQMVPCPTVLQGSDGVRRGRGWNSVGEATTFSCVFGGDSSGGHHQSIAAMGVDSAITESARETHGDEKSAQSSKHT